MRKRILVSIAAMTFLLSGCRLQKQFDVELPSKERVSLDSQEEESTDENKSQEELMGKVYTIVGSNSCELGDMSQLIFGVSAEEVEQYVDLHNVPNSYQREDGWYFYWGSYSAEFYDRKYSLNLCYNNFMLSQYYSGTQAYRQLHPLEDLDACSKEEAIAFCAPYAEILGYGEAKVEVYAWTLDFLQDESLPYHHSAPDETWQFPIRKQVWEELEDSGMDEEEILNEYLTRANEIMMHGDIPWEKKHEALCLIYRPYFNGLEMVSRSQYLLLIYVPYYEEIVYGFTVFPFKPGEMLGEYPLISQEEAVSNAMASLNINPNRSGNFVVDEITLVYTMVYRQPENDDGNTDWRRLDPCWRIDYSRGTSKDTIFIDAVDGFVCNDD